MSTDTSPHASGSPSHAADEPAPPARVEPGRRGRDWSAIATVMRKDLLAIRRSKSIMLPMMLVPAVLLIGLPLGLGYFARNATSNQIGNALNSPIARGVLEPISSLPEREQMAVLVLGYLLSPVLLVIPLMVSAVLAADAFAGEKERRTLEGLLHLPVADRDLFLAKVLVGFVPAVVITWVGAIVYAALANAIVWSVTERAFLPFAQWIVVMVWVAPALALLALGLLVIVSSRAKTTQEANQLGGAVILPLIFLAAGQTSALLLAPVWLVLAFGAVLWAVSLALVMINARRFTRDRLAANG